ncbi:hypothetical protein LXL04_021480 [Taraxacum kok-saghyz]
MLDYAANLCLTCVCHFDVQMANLKFDPYHNCAACFEKTNRNSSFHQIIDFMRQSPLFEALNTKPKNIWEKHIRDFWGSARLQNDTIHATIDGQKITVTQRIISEILLLNDLDAPVSIYSESQVRTCMSMMGYNQEPFEKQYKKSVFYPVWRYVAHVILRCMSCRRNNFEDLSQRVASMMIAFVFKQEFNYSSYIFLELCNNIESKKKFLLFPRFLQRIFEVKYSNLVFVNMSRICGTGEYVPLLPHMIDQEEEPQFPQEEYVQEGSSVDTSVEGGRGTIYYPSREDPDPVFLDVSDINNLSPRQWLSDSVINFYIRAHWSLIIVCMSKDNAKDKPIILHMDSLEAKKIHNRTEIVNNIKSSHWFKREEATALRSKIKSLLQKLCQIEEMEDDETLNDYIRRSGIGRKKSESETNLSPDAEQETNLSLNREEEERHNNETNLSPDAEQETNLYLNGQQEEIQNNDTYEFSDGTLNDIGYRRGKRIRKPVNRLSPSGKPPRKKSRRRYPQKKRGDL